MIGVLLQRDHAVVRPAGQLVHTVGNIGGGIGCPVLVGNDILTDGVVYRECEQLVPVCNRVVQRNDQRLVVGSDNIQLCIGVDEVAVGIGLPDVCIAVNDLIHVRIVCSESGGCRTVPGEHEVACGDILAVAPLQTVAERVGVGNGAVSVGNAFGQLLRCVCNDLERAVILLCPLCKTREQVCNEGCAVNRGVEGGVNGVRLGSQANRDGGCRSRLYDISAGCRSTAVIGRFGRLLTASRKRKQQHRGSKHKCENFLHDNSSFQNFFQISARNGR